MNTQATKTKNVGIITYHAAYNFGSVLQSVATQKAISKLGYDSKIIDYRPKSQVDYYSHFFRRGAGGKAFIIDLLSIPNYSKKKIRNARFESFISNNLSLTDHTYHYPSELNILNAQFDVFVSGSDQILNKHSNELEHEPWSSMDPYLLTFTDKKKISYASSPASMNNSEIKRIQTSLNKFKALSARESNSAAALSTLVNKQVPTVVDPTLLFSGDEWTNLAEPQSSLSSELPHDYILFYTLLGPKQVMSHMKSLDLMSKRLGLPVVFICPFVFFPSSKRYINALSAGPAEFIHLIKAATLVVTDSYHGTLFSLNLHTPFWSLSNGKGSHTRKDQILQELQLTDHIATSIEQIIEKPDLLPRSISASAYLKLTELKRDSISYLDHSLSE